MKTEKTIQEIMRRFKTSREDAMTAPDNILEVIPEKPIPLTPEEHAYGLKVAARVARKYGIKVKTCRSQGSTRGSQK